MHGVMIIPTGIGCAIGGHAGDATPAAKLMASCCDKLVIHPNVVNASDINEMTPNMLYVEGSMLDRFLDGDFCLSEVKSNRILVAANKPVTNETINAVNAARATIGAEIDIVALDVPLTMTAEIADGVATGDVGGYEALIDQIHGLRFDALAIHTPIAAPRDMTLNYYRDGGVNPWGGVEAIASRLVARAIEKPVAHAPLESTEPEDEELYFIFQKEEIDPRLAAEAVSNCYFHCVLKGLHRAPRPGPKGLGVADIDFLVTPDSCHGLPHRLCCKRGIPVIVVKENTTVLSIEMSSHYIFVDSYLEAAGVVMAMRAGVSRESVRA